MKEGFVKALNIYGAEIKNDSLPKPDNESENQGLQSLLEKIAKTEGNSSEVQKEIFDLQKNKQDLMDNLKKQLACLDDPACKIENIENGRSAEFNKDSDNFFYYDDNLYENKASFGDIIADLDWDIYYNLDKATPRNIVKKYLVEKTKKELRSLLDKQIAINEAGSNSTPESVANVYRSVIRARENKSSENQAGFISEKIVRNLLQKISLDADLPFEIIEADLFQDIVQKIDFIIRRKDRARGVRVVSETGVQFSINTETIQHKEEQVARSLNYLKRYGDKIKDIALVVFPMDSVARLKHEWVKSGRPAGGPGVFLDDSTAHELFQELLEKILSPEEIETYWKKAKG